MRYLTLFSLLLSTALAAQQLDAYIKIGLENNLELRQRDFSYKRSMAALTEARGNFLPRVDINARYSAADGGRTIDVPVGDLVNPVYDAIDLTRIQSGLTPLNIPAIENQSIPFLREREHETKISVAQPIFNLAILYNYRARDKEAQLADLERVVYARRLVFEIKSAYYNYQKTVNAVRIFDRSAEVVRENVRVSRSLFENDKVTRDVLYRAEAELAEIEQQQLAAENRQALARSYFNFLLNRDLGSAIILSEGMTTAQQTTIDLFSARQQAEQNREELQQLQLAASAAGYGAKAADANYFPQINFAGDFGYQGEEYIFNDRYDYWIASGVLQWNLFNGFKDAARSEQFTARRRELEVRRQQLREQIALEVEQAGRDLQTTEKILLSAEVRLTSALASFDLLEKKYNAGGATLLEYLDARTTATNAAINETLARNDLEIARAAWERVLGLYSFDKFKPIEEIE
jgi:outer membrane protein